MRFSWYGSQLINHHCNAQKQQERAEDGRHDDVECLKDAIQACKRERFCPRYLKNRSLQQVDLLFAAVPPVQYRCEGQKASENDKEQRGCHRPFHTPGRFSMKAVMPSALSSLAVRIWNTRRSNSRPWSSVVSNAALTISLLATAAIGGIAAMVSAVLSASASRSASGTTRVTRPERSASAASIMRPVRHMSIALALPTARVRRCDPPMPGATPSLISGWPNLALSEAMMKSAIIASSQPPPSAKPLTAAIHCLRVVLTRWLVHFEKKSSL